MARLFFAVWPDASAAAALARLAREVADAAGGRAVPAEKLHLTLAFLGEVEESRRHSLSDCARPLAGRFRLDLNRVGSFRRARVGWAGASAPPRELIQAQEMLAGRLAAAGFALEERQYTPHVTLARRIERPIPPAGMAPIAWNASELTLVRSESGTGRYTVLERWPLEG